MGFGTGRNNEETLSGTSDVQPMASYYTERIFVSVNHCRFIPLIHYTIDSVIIKNHVRPQNSHSSKLNKKQTFIVRLIYYPHE
jgi:hypothetical protein